MEEIIKKSIFIRLGECDKMKVSVQTETYPPMPPSCLYMSKLDFTVACRKFRITAFVQSNSDLCDFNTQ